MWKEGGDRLLFGQYDDSAAGPPQGATSKVMQRSVPDPEQPDVNSVRALRPQAVRRNNHVIANGPAPCINIYGDYLSLMIGFDLGPDIPFVYLVAQAGGLITGAGWRGGPG